MKKTAILALCLISTGILGAKSVQAEEEFSAKATTDATVTLEADNGGNEGEKPTGPGGGDGGDGGGEIDPTDPGEGVVDPEMTTSLRLSLLTAFDFGEIKMSGNTQDYTAKLPKLNFVEGGLKERPNFAQVTDNRGNNAGWTLTAKISDQFNNKTSVLTGSTITLDNGWAQAQSADNAAKPTVAKPVILTSDDDVLIAGAEENTGMGTWNILYGTLLESDKETLGDAATSVHLTIPGSIKKTAGKYTAKIEWTLNNTPLTN
ncbi:WxL domain-containing protein [Enterococcus ureasiticus]|uniref:WxL domain-containing protein n=1 Tax=Enterococcus ureasiticus TaxID=903984 RepID=A0A1E5GHC8_9ENTE|nr:WxL domain-containing protein [Enterococcus ureasiticus]OEG12112.1 hypothetical protein BCR21_07700 [Enterococcus ureasiticus]